MQIRLQWAMHDGLRPRGKHLLQNGPGEEEDFRFRESLLPRNTPGDGMWVGPGMGVGGRGGGGGGGREYHLIYH